MALRGPLPSVAVDRARPNMKLRLAGSGVRGQLHGGREIDLVGDCVVASFFVFKSQRGHPLAFPPLAKPKDPLLFES